MGNRNLDRQGHVEPDKAVRPQSQSGPTPDDPPLPPTATGPWEQIFAVDASLDPGERGAIYRLRFADGTVRELGDADDRYQELAHIIDSTYEGE